MAESLDPPINFEHISNTNLPIINHDYHIIFGLRLVLDNLFFRETNILIVDSKIL